MTYTAVLTALGESKIAQALINENALDIVYLGVGDGGGEEYEIDPESPPSELVNEVRRAHISRAYPTPGRENHITVEQVIPVDVGGFWVREIGVYDDDGDLIAIATTPSSNKPDPSSGARRTMIIRVGFSVQRPDALHGVVMDPSVALVSVEHLNAAIEDVEQQIQDAIDSMPGTWPNAARLGGQLPSHYAKQSDLAALTEAAGQTQEDLDALEAAAVRKTGNTGAALIPSGTDEQRPSEPQDGFFRYNSEQKRFEGYHDGDWKPIGGGGGLPTLAVLWWPSRDGIPAGYLPADGQLVSRTTYAEAWAAVQAGVAPATFSDSVWVDNPERRGRYSPGDGSTTFRLPDYNGKQPGSLGAVFLRGDGERAEPNIGFIQLDEIKAHQHENNIKSSVTGNIGASASIVDFGAGTTRGGWVHASSSGGYVDAQTALVASTGGTETRPLNVTGCWVIKVADVITNLTSIDVEALAADLALVESRLSAIEPQLQPAPYVSGQTAYTANGTLTFTHGLGKVPSQVVVELHCVTMDGGWPVGTIVQVPGPDYGPTWNSGCLVTKSATQIMLKIALTGLTVIHASSGAVVAATPSAWRIVVRALP